MSSTNLTNANALAAVIGTPVYVAGNNTFDLAVATGDLWVDTTAGTNNGVVKVW